MNTEMVQPHSLAPSNAGGANTEIEQLCRGFSGPHHGLDVSSFETIAIEYARAVTSGFLELHGSTLGQRGSGLEQYLAQWAAGEIRFSSAWDPVFGACGDVLAGGCPIPTLECAARLGLHLGWQGRHGDWELALDAPARLRFGRWLLPSGQRIGVRWEGAELIVHAGEHEPLRLHHAGGRWSCDQPADSPEVPLAEHGLTLLLDAALAAPELDFLHPDLLERSRWGEVTAKYEEAIALMRSFSPQYLAWIDRVLRYIIPLNGKPGSIRSGSSLSQPGMTHISFNCTPIVLAEMLVHEGTHQYFHMLTRLGPVDDGSDQTSYYSPIKRTGRKIHYILLAYHAFTNVLLFCRECRQAGYADEDGYCARNEAELMPQLMQLEEALRQTRALTPLGRSLWEPLAQHLR